MSGQLTINTELLDSLTFGEMEEVEELSGVPFTSFQNGAGVPMRAIRALAFVVCRKRDPALTWEASRDLTISDLTDALNPKVDPPAISHPPGTN
jgi:hypothetical protein